MYFSAEFGNPKAFYGNIQLGQFAPFQQIWGAWQKRKRVHEQAPHEYEPEPHIITQLSQQLVIIPDVSATLETIRRLKTELANHEDVTSRNQIREQLIAARAEKEKSFKIIARQTREDDEEAAFILFQ